MKLQDTKLIYRNWLYFYTQRRNRETKEIIPLTIIKRVKRQGINLLKEEKDLYVVSYKMLMNGGKYLQIV